MRELQETQLREVETLRDFIDSSSLDDVQKRGHSTDSAAGIVRCPLCPYVSWSVSSNGMQKKWKACLLQHLMKRHSIKSSKPSKSRSIKDSKPLKRLRFKTSFRKKQCVAGGSRNFANLTATGFKQFAILRVLFNAHRMLRRCTDDYMETSARILREPMPAHTGMVDRATIKLLTRTSVQFIANAGDVACRLDAYLRIGYACVTKGFAELFFSEYLMCEQRIEKTRHRLVVHFLRCGRQYAELMPTPQSSFWLQLLERILFSSGIQNRMTSLLLECASHEEFSTVSMDGLFKTTQRIIGQADYRASKVRECVSHHISVIGSWLPFAFQSAKRTEK